MPSFAPVLLPALAASVAGAIAAVSGFGIGSLLTPILLLSFAPREAVALVSIPHAIASAVRLTRLWPDVHWPTFRQFGVASAIGGLVGALLQPRLGGTSLTIVLGVLLVLAGSGELARRRIPLPQTPFWRLAGGVSSGFFGGLVGNQGGLRSAALLGFRLAPRPLVATATASAVIVDVARVPVYVYTSAPVLASHVPLMAAMSAGVVAGTFVGVPVLRRVSENTYRQVIGGLLVLLGAALIVMAV
jgi:uncharacterized membrane protein YfcA